MRPNILMIQTDQQRFDTLRANGNLIIQTPNLDRLARMGSNFSTCICQNPVCMPSRISMMTGQYCSHLGITRMASAVPPETPTIQKLLKRYGYETAQFGKLHYLPHANRDHRIPHPAYDFDRMVISDEPGCYEDDYRAWVRGKKPEALEHSPDAISLRLPPAAIDYQKAMGVHDGITHPSRTNESLPGYFEEDDDLTHSAFVGEKTVEFLEEPHEKPFFCYAGFYSPHPPFVAPKKYFDLYDPARLPLPHYSEEYEQKRKRTPGFSDAEIRGSIQAYYAMISEVDHYVGTILDALQRQKLMDSTVIIFTSDHGDFLGDYLRYGKDAPAPDCVSRVPLIFRVPEALGGLSGQQIGDVVESVDIVPTLLRLLQIPIPPAMQGDVLPVAKGLSLSGDGLGLTEYGYRFKTLRSADFRYTVSADGTETFFDLRSDPYAYHNVITDPAYADEISRHRQMLLHRMIRCEYSRPLDFAY